MLIFQENVMREERFAVTVRAELTSVPCANQLQSKTGLGKNVRSALFMHKSDSSLPTPEEEISLSALLL
jgi:hypothetical protein